MFKSKLWDIGIKIYKDLELLFFNVHGKVYPFPKDFNEWQ